MNTPGSMAPLEFRSLFRCTSKCRCGPDELPEVPLIPIGCPATTFWPMNTSGFTSMWQYRVTTPAACVTSTYQPQPMTDGEPSTSHEYEAPPRDALHSTCETTPAAAERIVVPFGDPRSTPSWVGRSAVRKPETMPSGTGAV